MSDDAYKFDDIAQNIFFPAYPVIASQILSRSGVRDGLCLDAGAGGGHLGIALAEQSRLKVVLLDRQEEAVDISRRRIRDRGLEEQVTALCGDVHLLPFADNTFDLVASRGSLWFWEKSRSIREICRVLKPGGTAYIGGGYGSLELKEAIHRAMVAREGEDWPGRRRRSTWGSLAEDYAPVLRAIPGVSFELIEDNSGSWVVITKERQFA